jgi:hypothetical protein
VTALGNGTVQTITRIRIPSASSAGEKLFFLDVGNELQAPEVSGIVTGYIGLKRLSLGMFDPITDRWYWNRMVASFEFGATSQKYISLNDWPVGNFVAYGGDLIYTMKAKDTVNNQYYLVNRVSVAKHLPVDIVSTGIARDGYTYYQWWSPYASNNLNSHCSPANGGWDRFLALAANLGRNIIVLADDGTVA